MSKYIPGNQKHLTLEDRKYIEKSLNAGCSFKDIARYLCKDPATISKKSGCTGSATGITKAVLTMHITFASTDIIAKKSMPVARSFSAVSNVPPVQPATRHVRTLSKNDVTDSIKRLIKHVDNSTAIVDFKSLTCCFKPLGIAASQVSILVCKIAAFKDRGIGFCNFVPDGSIFFAFPFRHRCLIKIII